jgi:hypothetical protein
MGIEEDKYEENTKLYVGFFANFPSLASFSLAATTPVAWGDTKQANYDTSILGTSIFWSNPLGKGGMNLATGKMTTGKDADIAFSLIEAILELMGSLTLAR